MSFNKLPIALATAAWLGVACSGCALPPEQTTEVAPEKQYRTGSHLPVKEGQATDAKTVDPASIHVDRPRGVGSPGVRPGG